MKGLLSATISFSLFSFSSGYDNTDPSTDHTAAAIELDEAGEMEGALIAFRAAAKFSPESPEVWSNLAVALESDSSALDDIAAYEKKAAELELNEEIDGVCGHSAECAALLRFGSALKYDSWQRNTQFAGGEWGSSNNFCEWEGVQCDTAGQVKLLGLISLGLVGDVSAIQLLSPLKGLKELVLMMNNLSGQIPDLSTMSWTPTLEYLGLDQNRLSGTLPESIGELVSVKELVIWGNSEISGRFPAIDKLTKLETLSAANCSFSGPLPQLHALQSLEAVYLQENAFTGSIPKLPTGKDLKRVWFSDNQLTGTTPDLTTHLESLDMLHLERNQLNSAHESTCEWVRQSTGKQCSTNHCRGRECVLKGNEGITWQCGDDLQRECAVACGVTCEDGQREELR